MDNYSSSPLSAVEQACMAAVDAQNDAVVEIAREIWSLREIGLEEFKSSKLLCDYFEREGFAVEYGLTGFDKRENIPFEMSTAFIATFKGTADGPTVGLLLEYDALPNGHSCGHNLIASSGVAAAIGIREYLKTGAGTLKVYGTPAEETCTAKQFILDGGFMDDVDVFFTSHGSDYWSTECATKAMVAAKYFTCLTFKGHPSHASRTPHEGRSALDAAMLTGMGIEFLREHVMETDRMHYAILSGGVAANIVPEETKMDLIVRANDSKELDHLMARLDDIIHGAELMTQTKAEYRWDTPLLAPNKAPYLYDFSQQAGVDLGIPERDFIRNLIADASSDVGNVAYVKPTVFVSFPVAHEHYAAHTDEFAAASNTDFAIENSVLAGKVMALSAIRVCAAPEEVDKIDADFQAHKIQ